jgi:hypothetical protein
MTESLIRPRPRRWGWLIPTCLVAVVWSLTSTIGVPAHLPDDIADIRTSTMFGSIAGSVVFVFVVTLGLHCLLFLRKSGGELVGRHSLFVLGAAVLGAIPAIVFTAMIAMNSGKREQYQDLIKEIQPRFDAKVNSVHPRIDAAVGDGVLGPEALSRPGGLKKAYEGLDEARLLYGELHQFVIDEAAILRGRAISLETNPAKQEDAGKGFDEGFGPYSAAMECTMALNYQVLDTWEEALDVLSRRPRRWEVQNNQFMFYREADMTEFNSLMIRIDDLSREIATMEARANAARPSREPRSFLTESC